MKRTKTYQKIAFILSILVSLVFVQYVYCDQNWQPRPIQLGTSGGNINDINYLYCCGGTLGALVQDGHGLDYILSNNHVLAKTNKGVIGEDIIQPGLIDQNCYRDPNDGVADLSYFVPISFLYGTTNKVDAAIAMARSGAVDPTGSILAIGAVSGSTVEPQINMPVKKSGRTTGLTIGEITAINATVRVIYNRTCGLASQTATFTGQIMIGPGGFSAGGDSGSLIVENCSSYPRAVGLLFAGSSTVTIANPIRNVLSALGVKMVGTAGYCISSATSGGTASSAMRAQVPLPHYVNQEAVEAVSRIKERHEKNILRVEGVVGMGVGLSEKLPGEVEIQVYVKRPKHEMRPLIPEILEDVSVIIVETGEIFAF